MSAVAGRGVSGRETVGLAWISLLAFLRLSTKAGLFPNPLAVQTALEWWPNAALKGELGQELPLPRHFEQAAENVDEEAIAEAVVCGPDVDKWLEKVTEFEDAGFDHVYLHQVGPDQDGFFQFAERELLVRV